MITEQKKEVIKLFSDGRKKYKLMEFEQAKQLFDQALKIDPNDGPSKVYSMRCAHYVENPPPEDWDGVFIMKTK